MVTNPGLAASLARLAGGLVNLRRLFPAGLTNDVMAARRRIMRDENGFLCQLATNHSAPCVNIGGNTTSS